MTFTRRLARDNGWSENFAGRVVEEYKRFLFLAKFAGHPLTPSDQVDQAWHLHLVYTDSYWNDLCAGILGFPFHHGPTKGGKQEGEKFEDWYQRTLDSYARLFGAAPPADIWPDSKARFRNAGAFRRINTAESFVIQKRAFAAAAAVGVGSFLFGCVDGTGALRSPITGYEANEFLFFYGLLMVLTFLVRLFCGFASFPLFITGAGSLGVGVMRIFVGLTRNRPIGFLVLMAIGELAIAFLPFRGSSGCSGSSGCGTFFSSDSSSGCGGGGCGGCSGGGSSD